MDKLQELGASSLSQQDLKQKVLSATLTNSSASTKFLKPVNMLDLVDSKRLRCREKKPGTLFYLKRLRKKLSNKGGMKFNLISHAISYYEKLEFDREKKVEEEKLAAKIRLQTSLNESKDRQINTELTHLSKNSLTKVNCPICGRRFDSLSINYHVNRCLNKKRPREISSKEKQTKKRKLLDIRKKNKNTKIIEVDDDYDESVYSERLISAGSYLFNANLNSVGEVFENFLSSSNLVSLREDIRLPCSIWHELYQHQKEGILWLHDIFNKKSGGILSDEQGLGKTITVACFLLSSKLRKLLSKRNGLCTLIIVPTTVLANWKEELRKWAPILRIFIIHHTAQTKPNKVFKKLRKDGDIILTTYGTLRTTLREKYIQHMQFDYIFFDEGHKLKNQNTELCQIVQTLKCPRKVIISGTPLQNNLLELWTLFDIVKPGLLGTYPLFQKHFEDPIKKASSKRATKTQAYVAYKCATVLKDVIDPYMLRRLKEDLDSLKLPDKTDKTIFCMLSKEQVKLYRHVIDIPEIDRMNHLKSFRFLKSLRHICNHPVIYYEKQDLNDKISLRIDNLDRFLNQSGKFKVLNMLLKTWHTKKDVALPNKVLLFSQSKQVLDIIESYCHHQDYTYLRMDGNTGSSTRDKLIKKFNSEPDLFLFLLTTRVGGVGINLQSANKVVIYDPDWNPTTDSQAKERAYRLGQNRSVEVIRLISKGTIEEVITQRQIFKEYLANKVLKDAREKTTLTSGKNWRQLFTLIGYDDNSGRRSFRRKKNPFTEAEEPSAKDLIGGLLTEDVIRKATSKGDDNALRARIQQEEAQRVAQKSKNFLEKQSKKLSESKKKIEKRYLLQKQPKNKKISSKSLLAALRKQ
eukprot:augustus_masked-scaffold_34-processed-gene-1.0-mRNA-1 protein AED:0.11 eAED:0.12 QI:0/-1/0/1/-1/1/1/0/860